MIIIYIDIVLLIILLCLTVFTCGYCVYRVYRLQQNGQVAILLRPTKVLFSHKKEGETDEELRTVVAYRNPFTGDYCVHKSRAGPRGYENSASTLSPLPVPPPVPVPVPDSPDSGLSDEYEPLHLDPHLPAAGPHPPQQQPHPAAAGPQLPSRPGPLVPNGCGTQDEAYERPKFQMEAAAAGKHSPATEGNALDKTWNWNYTEYQI